MSQCGTWYLRLAAHKAYCKHLADDPVRWGPIIAGLPPETRPSRGSPGPEPIITADLVIRTYLNGFTGYSQAAVEMAGTLRLRGCRLAFEGLGRDDRFVPLPDWVQARVATRTSGPILQAVGPQTPPLDGRRTATLTMWESTIVPAVETLNRTELVLVPCDWCAETFAASGVARPIRVVPLGMDPAIFHPTADPLPLDPLIFGCAGRIHHGGMRKGIQEVADSFRAAFPRSRPTCGCA